MHTVTFIVHNNNSILRNAHVSAAHIINVTLLALLDVIWNHSKMYKFRVVNISSNDACKLQVRHGRTSCENVNKYSDYRHNNIKIIWLFSHSLHSVASITHIECLHNSIFRPLEQVQFQGGRRVDPTMLANNSTICVTVKHSDYRDFFYTARCGRLSRSDPNNPSRSTWTCPKQLARTGHDQLAPVVQCVFTVGVYQNRETSQS